MRYEQQSFLAVALAVSSLGLAGCAASPGGVFRRICGWVWVNSRGRKEAAWAEAPFPAAWSVSLGRRAASRVRCTALDPARRPSGWSHAGDGDGAGSAGWSKGGLGTARMWPPEYPVPRETVTR